MRPTTLLLTTLCVFLLNAAIAQDASQPIEIEDYFSQSYITNIAASPDGQWVCYSELRWNPPSEKRNGDLWIVNTQTKELRRLTFDSASDRSPHWSNDGKWIYFASGRKNGSAVAPYDGKTQVWKVAVADGRVIPVTRVKSGIDDFRYDGGDKLYYVIADEADDDPWADMRKKFGKLKYGDTTRDVSEIWQLDLTTWRSKKIVDPKRYIFDWSISPDHSRIAMITTPDSKLVSYEGWSQVDIHDMADDKTTTLDDELWRDKAPSPYGWLDSPIWANENKLAFRVSFDGYPSEVFVSENNGGTFVTSKLKRPEYQVDGEPARKVHFDGGDVQWHGDDLYFTAQSQGRERVYRVTNVGVGKQGPATVLTPGDICVFAFSIAKKSGALTILKAEPQHSGDIFAVNASTYKQLTNINPQTESWAKPSVQVVKWKSDDGTTVEGILELPPGYKKSDGPLPTILHIHGGPTAATSYCFQFWPYGRTLLPSKGFALLSPNYRGSTGYGDKFMTDLVGRENDIDVQDLLSGIKYLVDTGIADPDRLGVMGWSNGGFLTNAIIGKSDQFKAASSGAGVIDQVMQWALEDTPGHVINYMENKLPWQNPVEYQESSPLFQLANTKTPTLIHVGENDERVPAAHAKTLFRALHRYKNVPTQLVIYPNTGHSPTTYTHRKAKMTWDVAWFEKYLLGKETETK